MATTHLVNDERAAVALADLLNGNARRRPVVVVTVPSGRPEPWIDVETIARETGSLADVYLMPTGAFTWEFSRRMADGTQVYGGAGRVYPVGHEWTSNLSKSPLRFAFNEDDGTAATALLVSDALRMAAAAGLTQVSATRPLRRAAGVVKMTVAGRALVDVGQLLPASVAEELTVDGVPIDRIVVAGQTVEGWYDADTNRLDVAKSLRPAADALTDYAVGDVVLAKVAMVRNGKAELTLYPKTTTPAVTVAVLRADVTGNPTDDLRSLMTLGEVVPARVAARGLRWALTLRDIDDDESIAVAPSLLPGGPPWLVEEEPEDLTLAEVPQPPPAVMPGPSALPPPARDAVEPEPVHESPRAQPTPLLFDRNRTQPVTPPQAPVEAVAAAAPSESTRALLLKIDGLAAEVRRLERAHEARGAELAAAGDTQRQLRYLLAQSEQRAARAEHDLKVTRAKLRKAATVKPVTAEGAVPRFADREQGFRHLVTTAWATRTLPDEQADRPLPDFSLGAGFLDSLDALEGVSVGKVADVVFEILTGLAAQMPSRELHQLRSGLGGDDPPRRRADGATCWRANLQTNTPAARRVHFWMLPSGRVELSRVVTHDDFEP